MTFFLNTLAWIQAYANSLLLYKLCSSYTCMSSAVENFFFLVPTPKNFLSLHALVWNYKWFIPGKRNIARGLGYDVFTKLVEPFHGKYHHVVVNDGFTSPVLCRDLFDNQTYLTGTVRNTRRNMPKSFKNMKLQTGERIARQPGKIMALKYGDR